MATRTHLAKQEEAQTETGVQARASDPGSPASGQLWLNTAQKLIKYYNGSSTVAIGGGGGGGSLQWVENTNSPTPQINSVAMRVYAFQQGMGQSLYAMIKVPSSYSGGSQIKLRLDFYSPDSSGNVLMQTIATLIRPGSDTFSSTTNQRTSSNSAVSLGAGTVNIPQSVTFDLTDTTGNINSIAVAAGHWILVQLTRGTDTGTSDVLVPVYGADSSFN
jgi:hypothetical protein